MHSNGISGPAGESLVTVYVQEQRIVFLMGQCLFGAKEETTWEGRRKTQRNGRSAGGLSDSECIGGLMRSDWAAVRGSTVFFWDEA